MGTRDDRVGAYISRSADFARPILAHLRALVHRVCPDVTETIKWGFPHFEHHGVLCSMASFKAHCAFGFWHAQMRSLADARPGTDGAMGQFGRITTLTDLPKDAQLAALIRKAAVLNAKPRAPLDVPEDLAAAFRKNCGALGHFSAMSASHRREYIEWLVDAKRDETRRKRLATAIEWIGEGKSKEWKYRGR